MTAPVTAPVTATVIAMTLGKALGVAALTAAFAVLGEVIVHRNRRRRATRERLAQQGRHVAGTVRATDRVSAGKYGSHKVRAHIAYTIDGAEHVHVAAWWPGEAASTVVGASIALLVDPDDAAVACVAGAAAPEIERDSLWRWFTAGVFALALVLALVS